MPNGPVMSKGAAWTRFGLRTIADFIPGVGTVYDVITAIKIAREGDPIGARLMGVAAVIDLIPAPGTSLVAEVANVLNLQRNNGNLGMDKAIGSVMVKCGVLKQSTLDAHLERQGLKSPARPNMPYDYETTATVIRDDGDKNKGFKPSMGSTNPTQRPIFDSMTGEKIIYPDEKYRRMPKENLTGGNAFLGGSKGIDSVRR